jgi:DNA-binding transcriptional regulator YdaS (Cro superfamily)
VVAVSIAERPDGDTVRRLRSLQVVTRVSYLRALRAVAQDTTQKQLASQIGISQPSVNSALKSAAAVPDVRPGFSGATPYEIAQRYDAGELTREQVIDELGRWSYRPGSPSDGYDWTTLDPGEFAEVRRALSEHLIEADTYDEILDRYCEQGR